MSAHTPGPWEIEPLEVFGRGDREGTAHIVLWDEDREGYTFVARALSFDDDESVANARLIAQAPRMLDLLAEARRTLEMWKDVAPAVSLCADIDEVLAAAAGGTE